MLEKHRAQAWLHRPAFRRPRHFHAEPELNVVLRGRAQMGVGRMSFEMGPGEVLFLRPGQDHVLEEASPDLELVVLGLEPELAERCFGDRSGAASQPFSLGDVHLDALREELLSLDRQSSVETHERIVTKFFTTCAPRLGPGRPIVRRAFAAMSRDPTLLVDQLAESVRVDARDLGRYFHRDLGLRLVEFRARLRLMRFIEQVDRGDNLTQAALSVFGSYSQCHRTFGRYLGVSPSEYFSGTRAALDSRLAQESHASTALDARLAQESHAATDIV